MSFRFVHAADLHLDTPFRGYGQSSPLLQAALRDASLKAFDSLVDLCIEENAAFLLLAGDIYDGTERAVRAQFRFLAGLQRLDAHGIQVFVIHGNHDPVGGAWSDIKVWPANTRVFGSDAVDSCEVQIDGITVATVYGISYPTPAVVENLSLGYQRTASTGLHVGLLHATVGTTAEHERYSPCSLADLTDSRMDYWALGHIHKRGVLSRDGSWVVYSGNIQGRSPKPSEMEPKGAYVVEVDGVTIVEPVFVPLDCMRFVSISVDVSQVVDLAGLRSMLVAEGEKLRVEHGHRGLIVRALLTGRGDVHVGLQRPNAIEDFLRDLRDEFDTLEPVLRWSKIVDQTRSELDRDAIKSSKGFSSGLINLADDLRGSPEIDETHRKLLRAEGWVRHAGLDVDLDPNEWSDLLDGAERLALDLLESGAAS